MIKHEGIGWRLEKDISRNKYTVLVGGDNFAFELSDWEWEGLRKVISKNNKDDIQKMIDESW